MHQDQHQSSISLSPTHCSGQHIEWRSLWTAIFTETLILTSIVRNPSQWVSHKCSTLGNLTKHRYWRTPHSPDHSRIRVISDSESDWFHRQNIVRSSKLFSKLLSMFFANKFFPSVFTRVDIFIHSMASRPGRNYYATICSIISKQICFLFIN